MIYWTVEYLFIDSNGGHRNIKYNCQQAHRNEKDDETMVHVRWFMWNNKTNVPIENTADDVHMRSGMTYIVGQVDD